MTIRIIRTASLGLPVGAFRTLAAGIEATLVADKEAVYDTPPLDVSGPVTADAAGNLFSDGQQIQASVSGAANLLAANSAAENAAAIMAAHDALPAGGGHLTLPAGTFDVAIGAVLFTKPVKLEGQGRGNHKGENGATTLVTDSATGDLITFIAGGCSVSHIALRNTHALPTAGAGLKFGSTTIQANGFSCENVSVHGFYDNYYVLNALEWTFDKNLSHAPVQAGLHIRNYANADGGDSCVSNSIFVAALRNALYAVFWESGSGVKFINNKVNWTPNFEEHGKCFFIRPAIAGSTPPANAGSGEVTGLNSLFLIQNNSFENFTTHGVHIDLTVSGGSSSFANVILQGNEFLPVFARAATAFVIDGPGGNRPSALTVSGNIFSGCIPMKVSNVDTLYIGVNTCKANNAGKALIELGANCFRVKVESQSILWGSGATYTRQMFSDSSAVGTYTGPKSLRNWKEGRDTGAIANGTDTVMYRMFLAANNGARLTVHLNAKDGAGNTVVMKQERLISGPLGAGVPVLATVGTDVALGTTAIITWDVATNNELSIKVKGNGTTLSAGYFIVEVDGDISAMNYGYFYVGT